MPLIGETVGLDQQAQTDVMQITADALRTGPQRDLRKFAPVIIFLIFLFNSIYMYKNVPTLDKKVC